MTEFVSPKSEKEQMMILIELINVHDPTTVGPYKATTIGKVTTEINCEINVPLAI